MSPARAGPAIALAALLLGCGAQGTPLTSDAGRGIDAADAAGAQRTDSADPLDANTPDANTPDANTPDAGTPDASAPIDAGASAPIDAGASADTGSAPRDAGPLFVAVGYGGRRLSSPDGVSWRDDQRDSSPGGDDDLLLRGVCHGAGLFVAVGGARRGRVMTSRYGAAWTERWDDASWIGACAYGNGLFVAVGGGRTLRSADGATWTDLVARSPWGMRDVAFGSGRFVAVGDGGNRSSSTDGVTWTPLVTGGSQLTRVAFGNGRFVAIGQDRRVSSADGLTWSPDVTGGPALRGVFFGAGRFYAAGEGRIATSTDGVSWEDHVGPAIGQGAYGLGTFVGISWPDQRRTSPDGLTWRLTAMGGGNGLADIAFGEP